MLAQHFSLVLVYNVFSKTGAPDNNINLKHLYQTTRDRGTIQQHSPLLCISVHTTNTHSSKTTSWCLSYRATVRYVQQCTVREKAPSVLYSVSLYWLNICWTCCTWRIIWVGNMGDVVRVGRPSYTPKKRHHAFPICCRRTVVACQTPSPDTPSYLILDGYLLCTSCSTAHAYNHNTTPVIIFIR